MTPASARWRAAILLYASIQFVVLCTVAMAVYADHYDFTFNFLSELGATRGWSGAPNHAAMVLFSIALGSLGLAVIVFAGAWRAFAFGRGRAREVGLVSQAFGTGSGAAFVAVALTPVNLALDAHNTFVVAAFGLLLGYAASTTLVWWKNGATRVQLAASLAYVLLVGVYFAVVAVAVQTGVATPHGREILVVSQKAIAGVSMLYVAYLTLSTRRQLTV